MKYLDEYRDGAAAHKYATAIARLVTRPWKIMEVCGGQTHAIVKYGIDRLLPEAVDLVHGPGCPVCVTPLQVIDQAIYLASRPDVIFCSFGDMLRIPGSQGDLLSVKAAGADVRIVYSPMDALKVAQKNPNQSVVFLAVGFETTAPANAMAVFQAKALGLKNFFLLVSHVLVPPAIAAILDGAQNRVQGFLAAGHVCTVMGYEEYQPLVEKYQVPIVVTGFEPLDILQGVFMCLKQLESGSHRLENQYTRSVQPEGNRKAQEMIRKVFRVIPKTWRGVGEIPASGLGLTEEFASFDANGRFPIDRISAAESPDCISGLVLQGVKKPDQCPAFGKSCTPDHPLGATMVSSEGACAAYYRYRRPEAPRENLKKSGGQK